MLPRINKVGKRQFPSPASPGRVFASPLFSCKVSMTADKGALARYAVVVSKKVAKSAVVRNRMRRRVFAIIRTKGGLTKKGATYVFYMRNPAVSVTHKVLEGDIAKVLG